MTKHKTYTGVAYFRLVAAIMVIAIHTTPLMSLNGTLDMLVTRVLGRLAVPFFFMVSGFFILGPYGLKQGYGEETTLKTFFLRNLKIYLKISLIYLPIALYSGWYSQKTTLIEGMKRLFFDGTFYHLWYFSALLVGMSLMSLLVKRLKPQVVLSICSLLYLIGLMGDSYSKLFFKVTPIAESFRYLEQYFGYTRNGFFFAPIFLALGYWVFLEKQGQKNWSMKYLVRGMAISLVLLLLEGSLLHFGGDPKHDSMYLSLLPTSYFLYQLLLRWQPPKIKNSGKISLYLYLFHPLSIVCLRLFAKVTHLEKWLIENSIIHFLGVLLLTYGISKCLLIIDGRVKSSQKSHGQPGKRAWKELSSENLIHNLKQIEGLLPNQTKVMAVVKDDGYGHGSSKVANILAREGVDLFAVATIDEGITLRKEGITQDILILGYSAAEEAKRLNYFNLIQSVVSYSHGQALINSQVSLRVHLKVDTGMHRLGFLDSEIGELAACYRQNKLKVEGIYSHLGSADQLDVQSIQRTQRQIESFNQVIDLLIHQGIDVGLRHLQSSYGVVNYPELTYDYVRVGIMLYGSHSQTSSQTNKAVFLKPVLTIKSQVVDLKQIEAGELIGYGNQTLSEKRMVLGVVSIGYGDGLPRNLSNQGIGVYFNDQRMSQIGKICMDLLIIDVTKVEGVRIDSVVTIVGEEQSAAFLAQQSETITNELYSRLGARLDNC